MAMYHPLIVLIMLHYQTNWAFLQQEGGLRTIPNLPYSIQISEYLILLYVYWVIWKWIGQFECHHGLKMIFHSSAFLIRWMLSISPFSSYWNNLSDLPSFQFMSVHVMVSHVLCQWSCGFSCFMSVHVVVSHVLCQCKLWFLMFYVSECCGFSCFIIFIRVKS